jgi:glyoxalase family protein
MPNKGTIRGTHHLTFCVGGAQEDYDFHVRLLGLKSVKKTVLFDGEIPIYHLYYGNGVGDASTLLTSFPYRQAGWMGKRGTNQLKTLMLSVPEDAIGFWVDRLNEKGVENEVVTRFGRERVCFAHPCGIPYELVGVSGDPRTPYESHGVTADTAIRGAYGTTCSVREPELQSFFITEGMGGSQTGSEGKHHEEPELPQGSWTFGEGTIHHQAFDVLDADNQQVVKDWLVGLGFTDVSESKDRGYFFSMYMRSPGGALCELAWSTEAGFTIDESVEELGTHMCIPPHWEDRRSEISQLEPIETDEVVHSGA